MQRYPAASQGARRHCVRLDVEPLELIAGPGAKWIAPKYGRTCQRGSRNMSSTQPPLLAHATRDLAAFAADLQFEDIPREAVERIKLLRARQHRLLPLRRRRCRGRATCRRWSKRKARSRSLRFSACGKKTSVALAVLVNSTAGHAFELDDIHKESIVHPGSLATPVALAFAEAAGGAPGRDVITGDDRGLRSRRARRQCGDA